MDVMCLCSGGLGLIRLACRVACVHNGGQINEMYIRFLDFGNPHDSQQKGFMSPELSESERCMALKKPALHRSVAIAHTHTTW